MQYTINHNGTTCNLPVFTRALKKKIDFVNGQISDTNIPLDTRLDVIHEFLREVIGEEHLVKAIGSADLDEIDLNELNLLYLKITKEYDRPITEYNNPGMDENTKKIFQEIDRAAKNFQTIKSAM